MPGGRLHPSRRCEHCSTQVWWALPAPAPGHVSSLALVCLAATWHLHLEGISGLLGAVQSVWHQVPCNPQLEARR